MQKCFSLAILKVLADFPGESICRLSSKVFADFGGNYSTDLHALSLDEWKLIYKARGTFHRLFCNCFVKVQRTTNDN